MGSVVELGLMLEKGLMEGQASLWFCRNVLYGTAGEPH
jgi:hypothetical protein